MSPGRCNTGLTTPRHAKYQIINLVLGNITPLIKQCPRSSGRVVGGGRRAAIRRPRISHTCSIGFKTGEYAGQSIRVISSD
ncbi:hypothetical protein TNCV_4229451 [Trichonephila clavipes]|nr:hypothetical protein TNCV_4229451 [Trichonephila clavipes]